MKTEDIKIGMTIFTSKNPFNLYTVKEFLHKQGLPGDEIILSDTDKPDNKSKNLTVCAFEIFERQRDAMSKRLEELYSDNNSMKLTIELNEKEIKAIESIRGYFIF
jgi:hypothetical protein